MNIILLNTTASADADGEKRYEMDILAKEYENAGQPGISVTGVRVRSPHDATGEVALPDYLPPVGRIVSFSAAALDEDRYLEPGAIEASGLLACSVTYAGDDGTICSYPVNCDFSKKIPIPGGTDGKNVSDFFVRTDVEAPVCRAVAPRKLSFSAKLSTAVFSTGKRPSDPAVSAEGGDGGDPTPAELMAVEYRRVPVSSSSVRFLRASGETTGEISVPGGAGDGAAEPKILNCSGVSYVTGVSAEHGSLVVRGETVVSCLARTADGEIATLSAKTPFEERLGSGADGEDGAAFASCASVSVSEAGGGVFVCTAEHEIDGELWSTTEEKTAVDAYSTACGSETVPSEAEPIRFLGGVAGTFTATGTGRAPSGDGKRVLFASGRVGGGSAEASGDGRLVISAQCTVTAAIASEGKTEPCDVSFPVRFEAPLRSAPPAGSEPAIRYEMNVISAEARLDGDRLNVNAEISVSAAVTSSEKIKTAGTVRLLRDVPVERSPSRVRIFFPDGQSSLWDVRRSVNAEPEKVTVVRGGDGDGPLPRGAAVIISGV